MLTWDIYIRSVLVFSFHLGHHDRRRGRRFRLKGLEGR
jgi:hypothetical protein